MFRRLAIWTILLSVLALGGTPPARAATSLDAETMKAALKTATPEEDGFITRVLDRVDAGTLPESLVLSTFLWAREKPSRKFQYFKTGLIVRAAQQGIVL